MIDALLLSLKLSFLTTSLLIILSLPLAYLLAYRSFPGKGILEALFISPIVLPPSVLGFYLLVLLGRSSPFGELLGHIFGEPVLFSFKALLLGSLIYSLPFAIFPIRDAFSSIPNEYLEVAYVYGYSEMEAFFRVVLPNAWSGILTASALVFAHTMGEFGVVLMVGGDIPGETRTLSIYIYDEVQALNFGDANRASLLLMSVSLICLSVVLLLRKRWVRTTV